MNTKRKGSGRQTTVTGLDSLAGRIVAARIAKGWTQEDLAIAANTTPSAVAKIENGRTAHPRNIKQLSEALNEPESWLLFGKRDEAPELDVAGLTHIIKEVRVFAENKRLKLTPDIEAAMVSFLYRATVIGGVPLSSDLMAAIRGAVESSKK